MILFVTKTMKIKKIILNACVLILLKYGNPNDINTNLGLTTVVSLRIQRILLWLNYGETRHVWHIFVITKFVNVFLNIYSVRKIIYNNNFDISRLIKCLIQQHKTPLKTPQYPSQFNQLS